MNRLAIASCLLALAAGATALVTVDECVSRFAEGLGLIKPPKSVLELQQKIDAQYPSVDGQEWDELGHTKRYEFIDYYPKESCDEFLNIVHQVMENVLAADQCDTIIEADKSRTAGKHPVTGKIIKAMNACYAAAI